MTERHIAVIGTGYWGKNLVRNFHDLKVLHTICDSNSDTMRRDSVAAKLKEQGIPTAIYHPIPLHGQVAHKKYPTAPRGLPESERVAQDVISLPMHPYLVESDQDRNANAVIKTCKS
ncbi:MAG: DegT/DnrJ/EryC1/StrS aminotransferase family protein [Proteobacteria bacterium]|nr:MAG: DegT/DnrJ/EryC1/StrS aminotransferase family protein [Pseudomonadota bacterium]